MLYDLARGSRVYLPIQGSDSLHILGRAALGIRSHETPISEAVLLLARFLTIGLFIPLDSLPKGLSFGLPQSRSNWGLFGITL